MTGYVLEPPPIPSVAVAGGTARMALRRVFCVGRNYAAHAREMGKDPDREPPFFFMKPPDAVTAAGGAVPFPPHTEELHYEGELVLALGAGGRDVPAADALSLVWGYAAGIDLTRRDVQQRAKDAGRPWDLAKGFDASSVLGPIHPVEAVGHLSAGRIETRVNGDVRQDADLSDMIWSVPEMLAALSREVGLAAGDLVFTGTPAGVGRIGPGDVVEVSIAGLAPISVRIAAPGD